jgi:hypothetical protein
VVEPEKDDILMETGHHNLVPDAQGSPVLPTHSSSTNLTKKKQHGIARNGDDLVLFECFAAPISDKPVARDSPKQKGQAVKRIRTNSILISPSPSEIRYTSTYFTTR